MADRQPNHPAEDVLIAFGLGKLEPEKARDVESHLDECPTCCETLLDLKDDTFVGMVRSIPKRPADQGFALTVAHEMSCANSKDLPADLRDHPRYRIIELIGKGGMGDVYKAEHRLMDRPVALKLINQQLVRNPQAVERFRREVRTAARLTHPNIVTAYDAEQAGEAHFLVMEFVDGTDLASVVDERGSLPIGEACDYVIQAAHGLQHAFEQGMVHRDIKPHNLMLDQNGKVRILDFGLAGLVAESALVDAESETGVERAIPRPLTAVGSVMGTPDFIAPEQARDARSADIRSDVYSLGCTLYFLLTAKAPFEEGSVMDKLKSHSQAEPEAIESIRLDVPKELAAVIRRLMAKDPADRFESPAEVAQALTPFVDSYRDSSIIGRTVIKRKEWSAVDRFSTATAVLTLGCLLLALQGGVGLAEVALIWSVGACIGWGFTTWTKREQTNVRPSLKSLFAWSITVLMAGAIFVVTNRGRLEIHSDLGDVEVHLLQNGKVVKIIDVHSGTQVHWLPTGDFLVKAKGDDAVRVTPGEVSVSRKGVTTLTIETERSAVSTAQETSKRQPTQATLSDQRKIQGAWVAVAGQTGGQELPKDQIGMQQAVFKGDRLSVVMPGGVTGKGLFQLKTDVNPKQIWIQVEGRSDGMRGIYRIDGDRLTVCMNQDRGAAVPTTFASLAGTKIDLITLQRDESGPKPEPAATPFENVLAQQKKTAAGKLTPVVFFSRNGKAAFRFGQWLLVFEGIDCGNADRPAKIIGIGGFRHPTPGGKGRAGKAKFGEHISFQQEWDGEANRITVVDRYTFKLIGAATRLEFKDLAYEAGDVVQTIVIAGDGSTRLETDGWLELLNSVDLGRDATGATWRRKGLDLVLVSGENAGLEIPVPPANSYELRSRFYRRADGGSIKFWLPIPGGYAGLSLNDWWKYQGLQHFEGKLLHHRKSGPALALADPFLVGERHEMSVRVEIDGEQVRIVANLDKRLLFDWHGPASTVAHPKFEGDNLVGLGNGLAPGIVWESLEYRVLKEKND